MPPGLNTTVFRVIQEAVSNALRHARAGTIRVSLRDEPDALLLAIEDDGIGFDPEAVSQRAKRGEHLGLLGMTERVQERRRHDHARFATRRRQPHRVAHPVPEADMSSRRRILLADDHALVRAGIRALLETLPGVEVSGETGDGLDAIERVRRDPPDAVLLDITLPGLNGLDVAARIASSWRADTGADAVHACLPGVRGTGTDGRRRGLSQQGFRFQRAGDGARGHLRRTALPVPRARPGLWCCNWSAGEARIARSLRC